MLLFLMALGLLPLSFCIFWRNGGPWVLVAEAVAAVGKFFAISFKFVKAALTNPVMSLRSE
jgi:hypothetical protein